MFKVINSTFSRKEAEGALVQGTTVHSPGDYISEAWRDIWPNNVFRSHYSDSRNFKLLWLRESSGFPWESAIRSASQRLQWLLCPFLIRCRLTGYSVAMSQRNEGNLSSVPQPLEKVPLCFHTYSYNSTFEDNSCMLLLHMDTLSYICCIFLRWCLVCMSHKPGVSIGFCIFHTC